MRTYRWAWMAGLLAVALLSGCATSRMIDSDVQSFTATAPAVTPATYRFERLPSQAALASQDALEGMARQALAKVGLSAVAGDAAGSARYVAQLSVQVTSIASPYAQSGMGVGFWGRREGHARVWLDMAMEPPWLRHGVRVVLREAATGQVAYETSATFDGPWGDSGNLLPVILDAAMQGYPNPPTGPRKVVIELSPPNTQAH